MNPYYYLFYKFNHFLNKKGSNEWGSIGAITFIIGQNIVFIYVHIFNINDRYISEKDLNGIYKTILFIIAILLFVINSILFSNKQRVTEIVDSYKGESDVQRKLGNAIVILYVVLSICLIVFG
ncbi:MAG TPA: hypothetical protein VK205_00885 [Prolixibacteraceae bacterium]|nr:hypothetical protein [Prolixibacteraceae bacterium]